jgi:hypothetical protein
MQLALLVVALVAYAFDCGAAATPEQAMQCCNSMPCSSGGQHGQDCCKTMMAMHAPFVLAPSEQDVSYAPAVLAVLLGRGEAQDLDSAERVIPAHCHAPPIFSIPTLLPLRI